jgi:hypothetical protein
MEMKMPTGWFEQDFDPMSGESKVDHTPDARLAVAAEYGAHHLGRISRTLEKLVAIMELDKKDNGGRF